MPLLRNFLGYFSASERSLFVGHPIRILVGFVVLVACTICKEQCIHAGEYLGCDFITISLLRYIGYVLIILGGLILIKSLYITLMGPEAYIPEEKSSRIIPLMAGERMQIGSVKSEEFVHRAHPEPTPPRKKNRGYKRKGGR